MKIRVKKQIGAASYSKGKRNKAIVSHRAITCHLMNRATFKDDITSLKVNILQYFRK